MTTTAPLQQVDLTAPSDSLTYVEILTPAGIVRVNTNLVNFRTGQPVVCVEIEPNTTYHPKTAADEWDVNVENVGLGCRTDVTLTRRQEGGAETHYQDATGWHRKHDVHGGPHDERPS